MLPEIQLPDRKIIVVDRTKIYSNLIKSLKYIYHEESMRLLIILFFINSLPIAITSNLFSFYIDQSLNAKSSMALFLI
jgi:hypothetical protein